MSRAILEGETTSMNLVIHSRALRTIFALVLLATIAVVAGERRAEAFPVAATNESYMVCGRVFSDPHAFWPSPEQGPERSPFAKGNAPCAASEFITYGDMVAGMEYLRDLFPDFVSFYNLEEDFGDGSDCVTSTSSLDMCSAGLAQNPTTRERSNLYMARVTDERVSNKNKKFFVFPLSIHGNERAGAEGGIRAIEDLATWAYCEAVDKGQKVKGPQDSAEGATVNCAQETPIPHPLLETQPDDSLTTGTVLRKSAIYFVFANPDGWRRGDPDNGVRFFQRYNGNGVDMNRDWPTIGFTFAPYTPWSESETRSFGTVLKGIRKQWDGGIDLHGQLVDRAFSFTLLGASQRDYAKDQRILQTVKGAWRDAENRLAWSPLIKPNDAPPQCSVDTPRPPELPEPPDTNCDQRMYGVQWGTVWDTIAYTVTGSLGDWIDSPLGLGADGIDNEMSLSHISNCGTGACFLPDVEQLHIDGNKSLIYAMLNFTLLPEDTRFRVPGKIGYVMNPKRLKNGRIARGPSAIEGLEPQDPIMDAQLTVQNNWVYEFDVLGPKDEVFNGGLQGKLTPLTHAQSVSPTSDARSVLEYFDKKADAQADNFGCGALGDRWQEVNRYYNQSNIYQQTGQAVHANDPLPGRWRVCLTGDIGVQGQGLARYTSLVWDLDITFSEQPAVEDPGQLPYDVSNMDFFTDLSKFMQPGQIKPVRTDDILAGKVNLKQFRSLIIADDPFPGFTEPIPSGPQAEPIVIEPPAEAAATAPCAWPTADTGEPLPTCVADYEFDVDPKFNSQRVVVSLTSPEAGVNDWDLYVQRQSRISEEWFAVGQSASSTGNEQVSLITPPVGHYRARIINWSATQPPSKLEISFSNEYTGPPVPKSQRSPAEVKAWAKRLLDFARGGGNLLLTDGAVRNAAYMGLVPRSIINSFSVYAGYIGFTGDGGLTASWDDALAKNVNQPGAAEGPGFRHQTFEPVPIGYAIQDPNGVDYGTAPAWGIDQIEWEKANGRTAGVTTADQVSLGEMRVGKGRVRVVGALLPFPTDQYYHPFGLASYAVTYSGYQVLKNALS